MNIDTRLPTELLKPFIKTYLIIESEDELVNRVLPGTSLVMAFRYKGHVNHISDNSTDSLPFGIVSGLRKSARLINYLKTSGNILVVFKEGGAAAFFKGPLHELFDETVSLDNFVTKQQVSIIEEQLCEAVGNNRRIAVIESFLLSILHRRATDNLILAAIRNMTHAKGAIKIKALAGQLYISQDAFEKRFRKTVGTSPKQFSSIIRMRSVINQGQQGRPFTEMAFDAGYFDQPHFNKDFKLFTGQTPVDFFRSGPYW